uniref:Uncharacterized protein n=1 Tax=Anguilla anguilla TaxID=7936 RepID=A0A0E9Q331_ANGAN
MISMNIANNTFLIHKTALIVVVFGKSLSSLRSPFCLRLTRRSSLFSLYCVAYTESLYCKVFTVWSTLRVFTVRSFL